MVQFRWKQFRSIEPNREYVVMASYLPLRKFSRVPLFLRHSGAVGKQLEGSRGIVGYALRAKILSKMFWTLSMWEDSDALMDFVRTRPHLDIMGSMKGEMGPTRFVQWKVSGSGGPPTWEEGLRRLASRVTEEGQS